MNAIILAFSGGIYSGKTTLSQEIANKLGWKRTSFGDYVRAVAKQKGIESSRENLQQLGEKIIESGWDIFCTNVLSLVNWQNGENLIVDGIRHKEALEYLKKLTFPSNVYLIYIALDLTNRINRIVNSDSNIDLKKLDLHSTEKQVASVLPSISDLIIDGNKKIEDTISQILELVHTKK